LRNLIIAVASGQAAQDFAHASEKTQRAENQREPRPRMQLAVEEIAHGGADGDGAN